MTGTGHQYGHSHTVELPHGVPKVVELEAGVGLRGQLHRAVPHEHAGHGREGWETYVAMVFELFHRIGDPALAEQHKQERVRARVETDELDWWYFYTEDHGWIDLGHLSACAHLSSGMAHGDVFGSQMLANKFAPYRYGEAFLQRAATELSTSIGGWLVENAHQYVSFYQRPTTMENISGNA